MENNKEKEHIKKILNIEPRGKSHIWRKMFNYFQYNQEEFLEHYHKRSNVETTFHMIKSKLGDSLKSKNEVAQKNELLCKLIAHNIIVLVSETQGLNSLCSGNKL